MVFMDDLILAGALSILALYAAVILAGAAAVFLLAELYLGIFSGDTGLVAMVLSTVLIFLSAYTGCGLWLQKSGRI